jgi:hypothetical protein
MNSCDSEQSSDDSGTANHPHPSSAVPNSLLQLHCDYASGSDDVVACTPEKQFEEEDGQSDGSDFHTPAQQSKRRRLPTVSPVESRHISDSDSDGVARDSLFDPHSPSTRKRGFKRPRTPWSLVKEWALDEYDREVAYEEIKTIMAQSLDEAGTKIFIKPNANSIAGWRSKQVSYSFLSICLLDTNSIVLYCRTMWHAAPSRRSILLLVHLLIDAAAGSNFELLRLRSRSSWRHRVSILPRVMYKTRFQSFCPFSSPQRLSKWFRLIPWSVLLQRGAVSSCFRIPPPKFLLPSNVLLLVRSVQRVCGHCSHFRMARNWTAMRAVLLDCPNRFICTRLWRSTIEVDEEAECLG